MSPTAFSIDIAESISLVTFAMTQQLETYSEASLPGCSRYNLYLGYSGFCEHAAKAALALERAFRAFDTECWFDIVEDFAAEVIAVDVRHATPASLATLAGVAEEIRRQAQKQSHAILRPSAQSHLHQHSDTHHHLAADATGCVCAPSARPFIVQFSARSDYRTTVYAQDAIEAEAIGAYLWDHHGHDSDAFEKIEETAGWSARSG